MASADLAVAKASLSATLFRADPTSCSRDDIDQLFSLLNSTVARCSPANVQKCKQWILQNLAQSPSRIAPFGKYLVALANSITSDQAKAKPDAGPLQTKLPQHREPSAKRKRLHILYILNDVFYHVKFRGPDKALHTKFEPFLAPLFRAAADFSNCPKHIRKTHDLISIWEEEAYFSGDVISKLRAAVEQEPSDDSAKNESRQTDGLSSAPKIAKEQPFVMPAMHGDPITPWYDLPAGNWLTALEPNSTRPMNPSMIKPLQLAPGPADKTLVDAVKKLLVDVDKIHGGDASEIDGHALDIDQMGETVELDELTGEIIGGDTYYGWSRTFCDKMKSRRKKRNDPSSEERRQRGRSSSRSSDRSAFQSRSPSRSRSSSRAATKRRRISASPDRRGHNRSRSRNRHRGSSKDSRGRRSWSRSRSISSRSRSRSRDRSPGQRGGANRGRSISPRYSPPPAISAQNNGNGRGYPYPAFNPSAPQPPFNADVFSQAQSMGRVPPMPPPHPAFGGFQQPVPPPPPPNYQGQWPPPPPPPPPMGVPPQNYFSGASNPPQQFGGGWPPAPPPPPPPSNMHPQNQYQYGHRGGGNFRGGREGRAWPRRLVIAILCGSLAPGCFL